MKFRLLLHAIIVAFALIVMPQSLVTQAQTASLPACAVTPNALGGQGFTLSGQGFTLSGQGFTLSGQGFTLSGQGFTLSGQAIDPVQVANEIQNNQITPEWFTELLPGLVTGVGYGDSDVALVVIDDQDHGADVLAALEVLTSDPSIAPLMSNIFIDFIDIGTPAINYESDAIAQAIEQRVDELQALGYNHVVLNMSFGFVPCEDPATGFSFADFISARNEALNAEPPGPAAISPVLECVYPLGESGYMARFGYFNRSAETVYVDVGNDNKLTPSDYNDQLPILFEAGRGYEVFEIPFFGENLVWTLGSPDGSRRTSTASVNSTICEDYEDEYYDECEYYEEGCYDECEYFEEGCYYDESPYYYRFYYEGFFYIELDYLYDEAGTFYYYDYEQDEYIVDETDYCNDEFAPWNPIGQILADAFGVSYEDVMDMFCGMDEPRWETVEDALIEGDESGDEPVKVILECVAFNGEEYTARFGYNNPNDYTVYTPIGFDNSFNTDDPYQGQPTYFLPGERTGVFEVVFGGDDLTWQLFTFGESDQATANSESAPCVDDDPGYDLGDYLKTLGLSDEDIILTLISFLMNVEDTTDLDPFRNLLRDYLESSLASNNLQTVFAVASSGNYRPWLGGTPLAPARWSETIASSATLGNNGDLWQFSQDGNVRTPGAGYNVGNNRIISGTSFATPGLSLVLAQYGKYPSACVTQEIGGIAYPPLVNLALNNAPMTVGASNPLTCYITQPPVETPTPEVTPEPTEEVTPEPTPEVTEPPTSTLAVTSFTLIDTDTNQPVTGFDPIPTNNGVAIINITQIGATNLSLRANTQGQVGSVVFYRNGERGITENVAPYAFLGDNNGAYNPWNYSLNTDYVIRATPYSQSGGNGEAGEPGGILIRFVTDSTPTPDVTPEVTPEPTQEPTEPPASTPIVSSGYSGLTEAASVRYRGNSSGNEIYLGVPDLGQGANRVEASYPNVYANWQDGTYAVTFSFDPVQNTITTTIDGAGGTESLTYPLGTISCPISEWNALDINVVDRLTDGELAFNNVTLNGLPLGSFDSEGWQNWTVTGFDFSQSFTVAGDLVVSNWTGSETNKLQLTVGCLAPVDPPTPEPTPEVTPEPTQEVTPEPTQEVTPEPTPEVTPEPTQPPTEPLAVTSLTLMDANTNQPIPGYDPIPANSVIDVTLLGRELNIRANVTGEIGSVVFERNGNLERNENVGPYAYAGDNNGDYNSMHIIFDQPYQIVVTPYSEANGGGTAGTPFMLTVTFIESGTATP